MTAIPQPGDVLGATLTIRLTAGERSALDELARARARILQQAGGEITASGLARGLIRRELDDARRPKGRGR